MCIAMHLVWNYVKDICGFLLCQWTTSFSIINSFICRKLSGEEAIDLSWLPSTLAINRWHLLETSHNYWTASINTETTYNRERNAEENSCLTSFGVWSSRSWTYKLLLLQLVWHTTRSRWRRYIQMVSFWVLNSDIGDFPSLPPTYLSPLSHLTFKPPFWGWKILDLNWFFFVENVLHNW